MARPRLYATEEERRAAQRDAWRKYHKAHKAERAAQNKEYCSREDVKARRREIYSKQKMQKATEYEEERVNMA